MDSKPFPVGKASLAMAAAVIVLAFVFFVPVKRSTVSFPGHSTTRVYSTWEVLTKGEGKIESELRPK